MKKAIIGKKVGMTQIFDENGLVIPVTVIEAGPCVVTQKKTKENDGYEAIQLGFSESTEKKLGKPEAGHLKKAGTAMMKFLKEFRLEDCTKFNVGDEIKADIFAAGDKVDITGISKGKGYAGVIKRYGASRTAMTNFMDNFTFGHHIIPFAFSRTVGSHLPSPSPFLLHQVIDSR